MALARSDLGRAYKQHNEGGWVTHLMAMIGLSLMRGVNHCSNSNEATVYLRTQPNMAMMGMMLTVVGIILTVIWIALKMKNWTKKVEMNIADYIGVQSERSEKKTIGVQSQTTYTAICGSAEETISHP
eukprot:6464970-Amphidinium_carterae.2